MGSDTATVTASGFTLGVNFGTVAAVAAAAFAALQWRAIRAQIRQTQVLLLRALSEDWRALGAEWRVAMMIGRGVGDYYVEVDPREQARYLALRRSVVGGSFFDAEGSAGGEEEITDQDFAIPPDVELDVASMGERERNYALNSYGRSVHACVDFLAQVGGRLLSGDVTPGLVYDAFGATVLNSAQAVRQLLKGYRYEYVVPGHAERVLALLDLLWAHAVRVGDHDGELASAHKRDTGSGLANRRRVRRLARREGGSWRAARLVALLTWAEWPTQPVRRVGAWLTTRKH